MTDHTVPLAPQDPLLEAVYYPQIVPSGARALALLALTFDRLHFPGVYIPSRIESPDEARAEIARLKSIPIRDREDLMTLTAAQYSLEGHHLAGFTVFSGKQGHMGLLEPGADELMMVLEEMIYGPPPPNFIPAQPLGFSKHLKGTSSAINGPGWVGATGSGSARRPLDSHSITSRSYSARLVSDPWGPRYRSFPDSVTTACPLGRCRR